MLGGTLAQLEMQGQGCRSGQNLLKEAREGRDTFLFCDRKMEIDKAACFSREVTLTAECEMRQKRNSSEVASISPLPGLAGVCARCFQLKRDASVGVGNPCVMISEITDPGGFRICVSSKGHGP